ncbi:MAG: hypothetical protein HY906_19180, partial [Deltaproteobacteria bacterium]|nr:hypothetical protein [Deltaproteobacteria bacterium]
ALAAAAEDLVGRLGGKAALTPVEATRLEAEAAHAQRLRWQACYRMIRKLVSQNPDLAHLWAAC